MQELLTMSMKELDRLRVIQTVLAGKLTWHEAAEHLTLTERQIGNVVARIRSDGAASGGRRIGGCDKTTKPSSHPASAMSAPRRS